MAIDVKKTAAVQRSSSIDGPPKARDPSWVFKGYVAFYLYGCPVLTNPKDCLAHCSIGGELQGPKSSRRFVKRQKKLDKQKQKCISVMNEPVSGSSAEQIVWRTAKTSVANSINSFEDRLVIFFGIRGVRVLISSRIVALQHKRSCSTIDSLQLLSPLAHSLTNTIVSTIKTINIPLLLNLLLGILLVLIIVVLTSVLVVVAMDTTTGMERVLYHQQCQHILYQHHCQHHVRYQEHCQRHVLPPLSILHTSFTFLQSCILPLSSFACMSMMMKGCCLLIHDRILKL